MCGQRAGGVSRLPSPERRRRLARLSLVAAMEALVVAVALVLPGPRARLDRPSPHGGRMGARSRLSK